MLPFSKQMEIRMTQHAMQPAVILLDEMSRLLVLQQQLATVVGDTCSIVLTHNPETVLHHLDMREVPVVVTEQVTWGSTAMTGLQLAREIKRRSPMTTVILSTAIHSAELERQAQEAEIDSFLIKPVPFDRLRVLVQEGIVRYFLHQKSIQVASQLTLDPYAARELLDTDKTADELQLLMQELDTQITAIQGQMYGLVGALLAARKREGVPSLRWTQRLKQFDSDCQSFVDRLQELATQPRQDALETREIGKTPR
jgi:response regulator RpfG family c-di-GMP phosphodiesterase